MRRGWLVLALVLFMVGFLPRLSLAQESMDSIWVNITGAEEGKDEEGKLQVVLSWKVFKKAYNKRRMTYGNCLLELGTCDSPQGTGFDISS